MEYAQKFMMHQNVQTYLADSIRMERYILLFLTFNLMS